MARVSVSEGCVLVEVSWLERFLLGERSHRFEIGKIRDVDPHPSLKDLMVHWLSRSAIWVNGLCSYEGQLIPSTRNPARTIAITLDEGNERVFVELDEESTEAAAERIREAIRSVYPKAKEPHAKEEPADVTLSVRANDDDASESRRAEAEEALATALIGVGSLSLGAGVGTWLSQGTPSALPLAAGLSVLCVSALGYLVLGR